ncbi:DegT/DnrJ/EryC1/StrS family aminotransferase [Leptothoe spongobia]|uniref:Aminotransferase class I/II-fold pyridoxal phosphate-dependent enzyme n=1 Tax=Leptothoe spongobia TAU-MAC 1115 TaxID=1967444 RepID=A0A947GKV3_9CYAN|nr:aminotransferase class I/II-fold pyridoxal phosphate-dependent enzyme [Leptothoe spongobia]MBT9314591.1 aminotransferase class I/II-fold pyridoxal phosphate-dependent enzyme [Leptothoe spongobia TAU-MAC 1115]
MKNTLKAEYIEIRRFLKVGKNQARNLKKILSGEPLVTPSLVSMTLDSDDVNLAKKLLADRGKWDDSSTVESFESKFAAWNSSKYALAFMAGRVALSACIYALGLRPGDEVIVPAYTCVVVPNAFKFASVKVVYSDIELDTYGLDINRIEARITSKTRAILLHHLYGLVCRDYQAIVDLAKHYNLKVIEDCAHSTGAEFRGQKVGNLGDVAFYSSEHSKIFTTIQGGIATTNNPELATKLEEYYQQVPYPKVGWLDKQLHNVILDFYKFKHPQRWWLGDIWDLRYGHKQLISTTLEETKGIRPKHYGQKMAAPLAAIGSNQLLKIDSYNDRRRKYAKRWDYWCEEHGYRKPTVIQDSIPVYLRYPILVEPEKKRNTTWAYKKLGVIPGVWFRTNIHPSQTVEGFPNADKAVECCINFPCLN